MKPGSLVVCIDNSTYKRIRCVVPELEPVLYTVRAIGQCDCGGPTCHGAGLLLEEVRTVINNAEMMYKIEHFREVLPADPAHMEDVFEREVLA